MPPCARGREGNARTPLCLPVADDGAAGFGGGAPLTPRCRPGWAEAGPRSRPPAAWQRPPRRRAPPRRSKSAPARSGPPTARCRAPDASFSSRNGRRQVLPVKGSGRGWAQRSAEGSFSRAGCCRHRSPSSRRYPPARGAAPATRAIHRPTACHGPGRAR